MKKKMLSAVMAALILSVGAVPALTGEVNSAAMTNACTQTETNSVSEPLEEPKYVDALIQDFSVEMFKELYKDGENSLISPLSLYIALSMLENGVDGKSREELLTLLVGSCEGDSMQEEDINNFFKSYMETLEAEYLGETDTLQRLKAELNLANSIWNNPYYCNLLFNDDYVQKMTESFNAEVFSEDFKDPETLKKVNSWVNDKTKGRIENVFDELEPNSQSILINALSFDAVWEKPFVGITYEGEATINYIEDGYYGYVTQDVFNNIDGSWIKTDFLKSTEYNGVYLKNDHAVGIKKDYVGDFYMAAIVPNDGISLEEYINEYLTADELRSTLTNEITDGKVELSMPKFEFESTYSGNNTKDAMKNLGVNQIFESTRDFSRMYDYTPAGAMLVPDVTNRVSDIVHKTYISVDGAGTKAAAVTAIECVSDCEPGYEGMPTYQVNLNRPFLFVICDSHNDMPVFMGALNSVEGDIVETPDPEPTPDPDPDPDPDPEPIPMPTPVVMGDVDGNGKLTLKDASMIQRSLAGLESFSEEQKIIGDINRNGIVDTQDSLVIQRIIAGL